MNILRLFRKPKAAINLVCGNYPIGTTPPWPIPPPPTYFYPPPPIMEKPMSVEVLGPPLNRGVLAYKKLQEAHASAAAKIMEQDRQISVYQENSARDATIIAAYKAIMDGIWPEDVGGSTGGVAG